MHPSSLPSEPKPNRHPKRPRFTFSSPTDALIVIGIVGGLTICIAAPLTFLADLLWSLELFRLWSQLSATFVAALLLATSITARLSRSTRALLVLWATLLFVAVIDSIDGRQDVLPLIVVALAAWSSLYAADTRGIIRQHKRQSLLYWVGCSIGVIATGLYLSAAVYYFILNLMQGPLDYHSHPLYGFGIIIAMVLHFIRTSIEQQSPR